MSNYSLIEVIAVIVCPILSVILSAIALFKSNKAVKQVNDIKIGNNEKKQEASNNINSQINQRM
ncbi:MAG: hypothetical protein ACI32H_00810 [Bacilli bacterium]